MVPTCVVPTVNTWKRRRCDGVGGSWLVTLFYSKFKAQLTSMATMVVNVSGDVPSDVV